MPHPPAAPGCGQRYKPAFSRPRLPAAEHGAGRPCRRPSTGTPSMPPVSLRAAATMSPFSEPSSPALLRAGCSSGATGATGSSCKAGAISHPGHATLLLQLSPFLGCLVNGLPLQARLWKRVESQGFFQDANREF